MKIVIDNLIIFDFEALLSSVVVGLIDGTVVDDGELDGLSMTRTATVSTGWSNISFT